MLLHTSFIFYIYYYIYHNIAKSLGKKLNLFLLYTSYQIIYLRTLCYIILINIFNIFILLDSIESINLILGTYSHGKDLYNILPIFARLKSDFSSRIYYGKDHLSIRFALYKILFCIYIIYFYLITLSYLYFKLKNILFAILFSSEIFYNIFYCNMNIFRFPTLKVLMCKFNAMYSICGTNYYISHIHFVNLFYRKFNYIVYIKYLSFYCVCSEFTGIFKSREERINYISWLLFWLSHILHAISGQWCISFGTFYHSHSEHLCTRILSYKYGR